MTTTAKDLIAALRRHHEPPPSKPIGGVLLTEVQKPGGGRRADALWVPVNTAGRGRLVGYETKVTRADIVQELRDPMKADAWEQHCAQWWLVLPSASLLDGLDVPERWGVLVPPAAANRRTMTVVRRATDTGNRPSPEAWGEVLAKIVYGGDDLQAKLITAERAEKFARERLDAALADNRTLRAQGALLPHDEQNLLARVRAIVVEIERLEEHDPNFAGSWLRWTDAADIARNLLAQSQRDRATQGHQRLRDEIQRDIERLTRAAAALAEGTAA